MRTTKEQLLVGEWACLGILYQGPTHGFAIAARLKPSADIGRVWTMSRPLTYRSLEQLTIRGYIAAVREEPGKAGGNRTLLAATADGRAQLRAWLTAPVNHLRDIRSELLLKVTLADLCSIDISEMLQKQQLQVEQMAAELAEVGEEAPGDVVSMWRTEASIGAARFLQRLVASRSAESS